MHPSLWQAEPRHLTASSSTHSKLVSTKAALDFLSDLRSLNCGTALEHKMMSKSADLIRQFGKEVDAVSIAFHERKVGRPWSYPSLLLQVLQGWASRQHANLAHDAAGSGIRQALPYSLMLVFCSPNPCVAEMLAYCQSGVPWHIC